MGYGLASTAVLAAAAIASFDIVESHPVVNVASAVAGRQVAQGPQTASLNTQLQVPDLPSLDPNAHTVSYSSPRYVMDARPVSYEPPSSF
jgi:hypothetical protein